MSTAQRLIVNVETGTLLPTFETVVGTTQPRFILGDTTPVEIYLVKSTGATGIISQVPIPAGATVRLAVGQINTRPTSGSWALTFGGDTTSNLAFNITPAALAAALNLLPSITAAGGVTCTLEGTQYSIRFNNNGDRDTIFGSSVSLVPASLVGVQTLQQGTASLPEVVLVNLAVSPIAQTQTFTSTPPRSGSYTATTFRLTGGVRGGGFKLRLRWRQGAVYEVWTDLIAPTANFSDISQTIFQALVNGGWGQAGTTNPTTNTWGLRVQSLGEFAWKVDFTSPKFTLPVVQEDVTITGIDISELTSLAGGLGSLSFATAEAFAYLGTAERKQAVMELQVETDGKAQTLLQSPVDILGQVIVTGAFTPLQTDTPLSATVADNRFVRRDSDQSVDDTSKNQIWENLTGATTVSGVDLSAALLAANQPGAGNAFATILDVPSIDQALNTDSVVGFLDLTVTNEVDAGTMLRVGTAGTTLSPDTLTVKSGAHTQTLSGAGLTLTNGVITFPNASTQSVAFVPANYLAKADNLAGLASVSTARTNLGLGTAATTAATDYLTKAGDLAGLNSAFNARTNLGLGTMATENAVSFLRKDENLSGITNAATARTNLGLGSMALETSTSYLSKADNLSGLANTETARNNLSLGTYNNVEFAQVLSTDLHITNGFNSLTIDPTTITFSDSTTQTSAPVLSSGTVVHGGGGGNIGANDYPDEIHINIGGTVYAMPARTV